MKRKLELIPPARAPSAPPRRKRTNKARLAALISFETLIMNHVARNAPQEFAREHHVESAILLELERDGEHVGDVVGPGVDGDQAVATGRRRVRKVRQGGERRNEAIDVVESGGP